jgi:uncharacterized membrane protein YhaH (DUF805 family)
MNMSFSEAVQSGFRRGLGFRGRSSRSEYWWFYLACQLFVIGWLIVGSMLEQAVRDVPFIWNIITIPVGALFIWLTLCSVALMVRRFHDSDRSAWWLLMAFVPLANLVVFLLFLIAEGDPGPNRYGPPTSEAGFPPPGDAPYGSPYGRTLTGSTPPPSPFGSPPPA